MRAGGYAWWYVDGISADGAYGVTVIVMLGSVFSTYYAWTGRRAPMNHCAVNVALYSRRGNRWAMTERGRQHVKAGERELVIGPSNIRWERGALTLEIDEVTCPIPSRIKGTIRLKPEALTRDAFALDADSQHQWWPIAPQAHIEVALSKPDLRWNGRGYFDTNRGLSPLESTFRSWNWSYARVRDRAVLFYDTELKDGSTREIAASIDRSGRTQNIEPPQRARLPRTRWLMGQETRADAGFQPRLVRRLEDTPFYARSIVSTRVFGEEATGMHERLSLDRLSNPLVRTMIPFRNPRAWR